MPRWRLLVLGRPGGLPRLAGIPRVCVAPAERAPIPGVPVSEPRPRLIVCTTCRAGLDLADDEARPGALLHAELARLLATVPPGDGATPTPGADWLDLREVACLANCERGCSAALAMPGKWTFFLGHLTPNHAPDLLTYAAAYAAHPTGTVMPSRRPASLRAVVLARLPHLEYAA